MSFSLRGLECPCRPAHHLGPHPSMPAALPRASESGQRDSQGAVGPPSPPEPGPGNPGFVTPWTVACQISLSMGFSRQEYWSGLPCPPPGDLLYSGTKPTSLGFSRQEHWGGLPFPSPMHESESKVVQSCLTLHDPMLLCPVLHGSPICRTGPGTQQVFKK